MLRLHLYLHASSAGWRSCTGWQHQRLACARSDTASRGADERTPILAASVIVCRRRSHDWPATSGQPSGAWWSFRDERRTMAPDRPTWPACNAIKAGRNVACRAHCSADDDGLLAAGAGGSYVHVCRALVPYWWPCV